MIKRVAVVKLGVNNGSGDGGSCFGIDVWTDTAKLTTMVKTGEIWSEKVRCSSNMKPVFGVECVVNFGKLFTNEQKFSLSSSAYEDLQSSRTNVDLVHCEGQSLGGHRRRMCTKKTDRFRI